MSKKTALRRIAINKTNVDKLKPEARTYIAWDRATSGFGCKVQPTGRISYIIRYRVAGEPQRELTLGKHGTITPDQARKLAMANLGAVAAGTDPLSDRGEAARALTLGEVIDLYAAERLRGTRTGSERKRMLRREFAPLLSKPIAKVGEEQLRTVLDRKAAGAPTSAQYLLETSRPLFAWAARRKYLETNPLADVERIHKRAVRERCPNDDELQAIWRAAEQMSPLWSDYLHLLVLTGQRRDEAAQMEWSEVDLEKGIWAVPGERMKEARDHIVHLSRPAIEILRRRQSAQACSQRFVFTTTGVTPISGFSRMKRKLDRLAGISPWRLHDIRRSVATGMSRLGVSRDVADPILSHSASSTTSLVMRTYQKNEQLEARKNAMDAWASHIMHLVSEAAESNVVPLAGQN